MLRAITLPILILIATEILFQFLSKLPEPVLPESTPTWAWVLIMGVSLLPSCFAYGLAGWNVLKQRLGGLWIAGLAGLIVLCIETIVHLGAEFMFQTFTFAYSFVDLLRPLIDLTPYLSTNQMAALGVLVSQLIMAPLYIWMSILGGVAIKIRWRLGQ